MRTLIVLAAAISVAFALTLAGPRSVSACTGCNVTFMAVVTSDDTVVPARDTRRPGGRFVDRVDDDRVRRSPITLRSRSDSAGSPLLGSRRPIAPVRATLDSCGTSHGHGLPDTATAAAADSPGQGLELPGRLIALAALLGAVAMLRRLALHRYPRPIAIR